MLTSTSQLFCTRHSGSRARKPVSSFGQRHLGRCLVTSNCYNMLQPLTLSLSLSLSLCLSVSLSLSLSVKKDNVAPLFKKPPTSFCCNNGFASPFPGVFLLSSCQAWLAYKSWCLVYMHSQFLHPWGQFALKPAFSLFFFFWQTPSAMTCFESSNRAGIENLCKALFSFMRPKVPLFWGLNLCCSYWGCPTQDQQGKIGGSASSSSSGAHKGRSRRSWTSPTQHARYICQRTLHLLTYFIIFLYINLWSAYSQSSQWPQKCNKSPPAGFCWYVTDVCSMFMVKSWSTSAVFCQLDQGSGLLPTLTCG